MRAKHFTILLIATIGLSFLSLGLIILEKKDIKVSINGMVCNHSSTDLSLAVTKGKGHKVKIYMLAPGRCTNFFKEDVEGIWGKECTADPCKYQAWKLGVGLFDVYEAADSHSGVVLRIRGLGVGSSWHITRDWIKPDLSTINYSLVR
jgi:hypothetical protein